MLINKIFDDINFTKKNLEDIIPFLDVVINKSNTETFKTCVYRRLNYLDQILNYRSNSPMKDK